MLSKVTGRCSCCAEVVPFGNVSEWRVWWVERKEHFDPALHPDSLSAVSSLQCYNGRRLSVIDDELKSR